MKKVIIVDDEVQFASNVARTLQGMDNQLQVTAVKSSEDALKELENSPVNIVITDMKLPAMSGIKLAEVIKNRWPDVAIIMMTAYGTEDVIKMAFTSGAMFYIEKPFKIENLANMIKMAGFKKTKTTALKQTTLSNPRV
ncbi:MAG: response regulator [Deltaproteobacteria bacterium]|nr:response regulator [Deltaproteobacteria bacterium]